jgi:hypothetical protein
MSGLQNTSARLVDWVRTQTQRRHAHLLTAGRFQVAAVRLQIGIAPHPLCPPVEHGQQLGQHEQVVEPPAHVEELQRRRGSTQRRMLGRVLGVPRCRRVGRARDRAERRLSPACRTLRTVSAIRLATPPFIAMSPTIDSTTTSSTVRCPISMTPRFLCSKGFLDVAIDAPHRRRRIHAPIALPHVLSIAVNIWFTQTCVSARTR